MSKLENVSKFLGIQMKTKRNSLTKEQESYIIKLLSKYNRIECKPSDIYNPLKFIPSDF